MVVADASFLIDVLHGKEAALEKVEEMGERSGNVWIPSPALQELYHGAQLHHDPDRELARVEALEAAMPPIPFDPSAARLAGEIRGQLEREGQPTGYTDAQIAALARLRNEAVLTRDRGFERIPAVRVEPY